MKARTSVLAPAVVLALALISTLTLGCVATRPPLTCPAEGGPSWTEVSSAHFLVQTDRGLAEARQLAVDLETSRAALIQVLGAPRDEAARPLLVTVFERAVDLRATMRRRYSGVHFERLLGDLDLRRAIALHGDVDYLARTTLQHELVHELLSRRVSRIPRWMNEGYAELYSTLRIEGSEMVVGEIPQDVDFWAGTYTTHEVRPKFDRLWIAAHSAPSFNDLLAATTDFPSGDPETYAYYAGACKLVHALRGDTNPALAPRFEAMTSAIVGGEDADTAFPRAYRGVLMSEIEGAYLALLTDNNDHLTRLPFEPPRDLAVSARPMSDAEVHILWGRFIATFGRGVGEFEPLRNEVEGQLLKGLDHTPGSPDLLYARAVTQHLHDDDAPALEAVTDLLAADPKNPKYLTLDLDIAIRDAARPASSPSIRHKLTALRAKATALLAANPTYSQRLFAAFAIGRAGDFDTAVAHTAALVAEDPSCGLCFEVHAKILYLLHRLPEARAAASRALALASRGHVSNLEQVFTSFEDLAKLPPPSRDSPPPKAP